MQNLWLFPQYVQLILINVLVFNCEPAVNSGALLDVAYLDFRKAFDTVDKDVPNQLKRAVNYMRNRHQANDWSGQWLEPYVSWFRVSQRSNLRPLELILIVNDLLDVIRYSTCHLFADALKLIPGIVLTSSFSGHSANRSVTDVIKMPVHVEFCTSFNRNFVPHIEIISVNRCPIVVANIE